MPRTRYTARSPVGYVIRTAEPAVAASLSRGGYRVTARTTTHPQTITGP